LRLALLCFGSVRVRLDLACGSAYLNSMILSVLDQSFIVSGRSPQEAIRETVALAKLCEALGYHRFWVSEHHNSESVAGSAPEVLLGALAVSTRTLRIGAAGIMLPHYSSLHVAEQFRVLEALAPGRVDLGLGRAPGSDGRTAFALNPNAAAAADAFPAQVREVQAWVSGGPLPDHHPFGMIKAQPAGPTSPQIWILGSSTYGAQVAAFFGLPYCFAYFFSDGLGAEEALATYRANFRPSAGQPAPYAAIAVFALAAETRAQAERLLAPREVWRAERERGRYVPLPSPEQAASYAYTTPEQIRRDEALRTAVFGTPDDVAARLSGLAGALSVDEVAIVTAAHDPADRRRSFQLIAAAVGLARPMSVAA
jgi:luciferase family oxidoreductase group 1